MQKTPEYFNKWLVIVNPNAGNGKSKKQWPMINNLLDKAGISTFVEFTQHKKHAEELTISKIEKGFRKILVVGGDGTLNEVMNGIFKQSKAEANDFILGMIPVGTGNDWSKMFSIPNNFSGIVQMIRDEKTTIQDIGEIKYFSEGREIVHYFMNSSGIGFDALVANKTNLLKEKKTKGGTLLYIYSLISILISFRTPHMKIIVDNNQLEDYFFSCGIGIGKFKGGGMKMIPHAITDDGLFSVTIIKRVNKLKVLRNIKNIFNGSFIKLPEVSTFNAKYIRVESKNNLLLEAEGEILGNPPYTFSILPLSLKIIGGEYRN